MERHIDIGQFGWFRLHDIKGSVLGLQTSDERWVCEAEAAECVCFGVVDGVSHDGADGRTEPIAHVDVCAVFEGEGLEC